MEKARRNKNKGNLSEDQFDYLKPHQCQIPRLSGRPKVRKDDHPLREIVDNTGSVAKNTDKHVSQIISKYAVENPYRLTNTEDFVNRVKDLKILLDETLVSYDVVAIYPSIPQDRALDIVYQKLVNDTDLIDKTKMTSTEVIELLRICVGEVYFVFNNKLYMQIKGLAIEYSSSGFKVDIFMETIESRALQTFTNPPSFWARFVDDVYSNPKTITKDRFLIHLKEQDPNIDWP